MNELKTNAAYIEFESSGDGITTLRIFVGDECDEDTKKFAFQIMAELVGTDHDTDAILDSEVIH